VMKKNLLSQKTTHNNKFSPIKLGMEKQGKYCINFVWICSIPWLCIFKMQNHPSKLGIHWWRCITLIHKLTKCNLNKSCIIYKKNKMNINDYSTKVKNLIDVFAFIWALVDDENLMIVTLNGLGKIITNFVLQLEFEIHLSISNT
jgi:hypothetical protein